VRFEEAGWELHADGRLDFAFWVGSAGELRALAERQEWPSVGRLARHLEGARDSGLGEGVWLEIDERSAGGEPSLFLATGRWQGHEARRQGEAWDPPWIAAVECMTGQVVTSGQRAALRRCSAAIPARARLAQVGAIAGGKGAVRTCVTNPAAGEVLPFLAAVGWSGEIGVVGKVLGIARRLESVLTIHLDLEGEPREGLGIELAPRTPNEARTWPRHVEELMAAGILEPGLAGTLLQWHRAGGDVYRQVSHVKVVCGHDAVRVKAYLRFVAARPGAHLEAFTAFVRPNWHHAQGKPRALQASAPPTHGSKRLAKVTCEWPAPLSAHRLAPIPIDNRRMRP
jgi:hypothetical protein